jgi:hypothetical protein
MESQLDRISKVEIHYEKRPKSWRKVINISGKRQYIFLFDINVFKIYSLLMFPDVCSYLDNN